MSAERNTSGDLAYSKAANQKMVTSEHKVTMVTLKSKAIPVQTWTGLGKSRSLGLPDFKTTGTWRRWRQPYAPAAFTPQEITPVTSLTRSRDHSAAGRIMSMKNSNDTIGNRTRDLPAAPPRTPYLATTRIDYGTETKEKQILPTTLQYQMPT